MTFEEMEKWAERHEQWAKRMDERQEALAQSLELLAHDIHESQAHLSALRILVEETVKSVADLRGAVEALARVAESHERRITRLEGGQ